MEDEYDNTRRRRQFRMLKDKNEFNKGKRNRSIDFIKQKSSYAHDFGDVSENEDEEMSDSSLEKKQARNVRNQKNNKTYSIGYLTKTIWSKTKIYSDDFDADFEVLKQNQKNRFMLGSVVNSAILEDSEQSEIENPYFSDNSSSSHFTMNLRKFSIDLNRCVDKSDNDSSKRSVGGTKKGKLSHYTSNLNEPI